jgi:outer membrane immunogenic protein
MNKRTLLFVSLLAFLSVSKLSSQFTFIGASANYGSWIKEIGGSVYGIYSINSKIDIVPNVTYFLPHTVEITGASTGSIEYTWWTINLDGHYVFIEKSVFHIFGLIGLNFTNLTAKTDELYQGQPFRYKSVTTKAGFDVGAGVQFQLSKFFTPFVEIKYVLGERDQAVASMGFLVRIRPDRVREE